MKLFRKSKVRDILKQDIDSCREFLKIKYFRKNELCDILEKDIDLCYEFLRIDDDIQQEKREAQIKQQNSIKKVNAPIKKDTLEGDLENFIKYYL